MGEDSREIGKTMKGESTVKRGQSESVKGWQG